MTDRLVQMSIRVGDGMPAPTALVLCPAEAYGRVP